MRLFPWLRLGHIYIFPDSDYDFSKSEIFNPVVAIMICDENIVAQAYHVAIEEYKGQFAEIEFAIYCRDYETENYIAFASQFGANR